VIDDVDASAVMKACKVDLGTLKEKLTYYIDIHRKEGWRRQRNLVGVGN
jgi:hypothetical protein